MKLELDEYLDVLERNPAERACIFDIFCEFGKLTKFIKELNFVVGDEVYFSVIASDGLRAYNRNTEIAISRGLIDLSLSLSIDLGTKNINYYTPSDSSKFERIGGLLWIVAHEYIHFARGHEEIWNNHSELRRALEYDADCHAVAALYRYFALVVYPYLEPLEIKKRVLSAIYWPVRKLIGTEIIFDKEDKEHPAWYVRLRYILVKLTCIEVPHINFGVTQTWQENLEFLLTHLISCERSYFPSNSKIELKENKFFSAYIAEDTTRIVGNIANKWELAEPLVKKSSRMMRDRQDCGARVAFLDSVKGLILIINGWQYSAREIRGVMMPNFHARTGATRSNSYFFCPTPINYRWEMTSFVYPLA